MKPPKELLLAFWMDGWMNGWMDCYHARVQVYCYADAESPLLLLQCELTPHDH